MGINLIIYPVVSVVFCIKINVLKIAFGNKEHTTD